MAKRTNKHEVSSREADICQADNYNAIQYFLSKQPLD